MCFEHPVYIGSEIRQVNEESRWYVIFFVLKLLVAIGNVDSAYRALRFIVSITSLTVKFMFRCFSDSVGLLYKNSHVLEIVNLVNH
jgi:hypothetical protein